MARTDTHRPSAIDPTEYEYVAPEYLGPNAWEAMAFYRGVIMEHMARTKGTYSHHAHGGNCMVCGNAQALYTVLFYHAKTNTYVRMGTTCADKVEAKYSMGDTKALRRKIDDARQFAAGLAKAQVVLQDLGLTRAWEIRSEVLQAWQASDEAQAAWSVAQQAAFEANGHNSTPDHAPYPKRAEVSEPRRIVVDIVSKLIRYGSMSDKQAAFIRTLIERIDNEQDIKAQREAEKAAAQPVPTGKRIEVEGVVLVVKWQDSDYGSQLKMLVKGDGGWTVWSTVPAAWSPEKGDRVKFRADIELSREGDGTFGIAKRPHPLELVQLQEEA